MFVGIQLVGNVEVGVAEEIKGRSKCLVRLQRFQDCLRRMSLVDEQRQGRNRDLLPLGFTTTPPPLLPRLLSALTTLPLP
ncbi:MAG: hypothetical protein ACOVS5_19040, partial [Oligoflexus sp.]